MSLQDREDQVQRLSHEINTVLFLREGFLQEGYFQGLTRERLSRELPLRVSEIRQQILYLQDVIQEWPESEIKTRLLQRLQQGLQRLPRYTETINRENFTWGLSLFFDRFGTLVYIINNIPYNANTLQVYSPPPSFPIPIEIETFTYATTLTQDVLVNITSEPLYINTDAGSLILVTRNRTVIPVLISYPDRTSDTDVLNTEDYSVRPFKIPNVPINLSAIPFRAKLFDSVPLLVKTISFELAPINSAITSRESSRITLAAFPKK